MLNKVIIMGRLVRDPELRNANGIPVCSFRIACDRDYKSQSGEREADFVDVTAWRKLGETVAQYFSKGRMAVVEGRLQIRSFTDRNGEKRTATEIVAEHVYFWDSKPTAQGSGAYPAGVGGNMNGYGRNGTAPACHGAAPGYTGNGSAPSYTGNGGAGGYAGNGGTPNYNGNVPGGYDGADTVPEFNEADGDLPF